MKSRCEESTHWERPWCWERLRTGGEGDDRGWDGWTVSQTQWAWVWENWEIVKDREYGMLHGVSESDMTEHWTSILCPKCYLHKWLIKQGENQMCWLQADRKYHWFSLCFAHWWCTFVGELSLFISESLAQWGRWMQWSQTGHWLTGHCCKATSLNTVWGSPC